MSDYAWQDESFPCCMEGLSGVMVGGQTVPHKHMADKVPHPDKRCDCNSVLISPSWHPGARYEDSALAALWYLCGP